MLPSLKNDQASELRRLMSASRSAMASSASQADTIAVAGASVHSGASRFARILTVARGNVDEAEAVRFEACPPGSTATNSPVFSRASQRIVIVTPDEVDIIGAFSLLKLASEGGLVDDSMWIVAHRCVGIADQQMILGTLQATCHKHLGRELAHLVAVEESLCRGNAITPDELLVQLLATRPHNRLAANADERL